MARKQPVADTRRIAAVDFYGALQRALDSAQRQLARADNAFADFVVKEFKVDAAVRLRISALGVLQFELADEMMRADSVSRISLTLAAVAKPGGDAHSRNLLQTDLTALADLAWLPPVLVAQLAEHDIRTVSEFLGFAADARLSAQIVPLLKVRAADVQKWAERLRLLVLPQMNAAYLELLGKHGIQSLVDLAEASDDAVAKLRLPADLLACWREEAKQRKNQYAMS
ncbi:MAG TPA: DUF4332 domain-containing protein [Thermoanaerobaculia bacterium]|jgi:hypothetical protein